MWQRGKPVPDLLITLENNWVFSIYLCSISEFFLPAKSLTGKYPKVDSRYPLTTSLDSFHHSSIDVPMAAESSFNY